MSTLLKLHLKEFPSLVIKIQARVLSLGLLPHITLWYFPKRRPLDILLMFSWMSDVFMATEKITIGITIMGLT